MYVDDIILIRNSPTPIRTFISRSHQEFSIKDLGNLNYFLGLEVTYTNDGLFLGKTIYTNDILARSDMFDCKPISTPLASAVTLSKDEEPFGDITKYHSLVHSLVGALQYLTITRPNISFVVNHVSQFLQSPTQ